MKKVLPILCVSALMITSLAGCGTASATSSAAASAGTADYSNTTLVGKVQSVDGRNVTLELGELTQQEPSSAGGTQTPPSGAPSGGTQTPPSGAPAAGQASASPASSDSAAQQPAQSDGQSTSDGTQKGPAQGNGGWGGGGTTFTSNNETATVIVGQDAAITVEGRGGQTSDGSLSDLTEGAVLAVTVGDSNTVTSVTVKRVMGGGSHAGGPQSSDGSGNSGAAPAAESGAAASAAPSAGSGS